MEKTFIGVLSSNFYEIKTLTKINKFSSNDFNYFDLIPKI